MEGQVGASGLQGCTDSFQEEPGTWLDQALLSPNDTLNVQLCHSCLSCHRSNLMLMGAELCFQGLSTLPAGLWKNLSIGVDVI